jgi:hypothetical protein
VSETTPGAAEVLARARRDGQAWVDDDVAARIAAGAAPATQAVAIARHSMPGADAMPPSSPADGPADAVRAGVALLAALESLAPDDA